MKIVAHVKLSQRHPSVSTEFEMPDDSTEEEIDKKCSDWASEQMPSHFIFSECWWEKKGAKKEKISHEF